MDIKKLLGVTVKDFLFISRREGRFVDEMERDVIRFIRIIYGEHNAVDSYSQGGTDKSWLEENPAGG